MHGSFETAVPVEREPLPLAVRQQIHEVIRDGNTVVFVEEHGRRWDLLYRDGSRLVRSVIRIDEASAA